MIKMRIKGIQQSPKEGTINIILIEVGDNPCGADVVVLGEYIEAAKDYRVGQELEVSIVDGRFVLGRGNG